MAVIKKSKDREEWIKLSDKEKSFGIKLLHHFHYKKKGICWRNEEAITWELIRALDVLPRDYFLKEFLLTVNEKNPSLSNILEKLIKNMHEVQVEEYPRLGLIGSKWNSKSDIGLRIDNACLWIEVKTQKDKNLKEQIKTEKSSPNLMKNNLKGVVALIPRVQELNSEKIYWKDVLSVLEKTAEKIDKEANNNKTMKGYSKICHELLNRIKSWKEIL